MPAQSRYSLSDWNAMLHGCVVRYANDVIHVDEVRESGGSLTLIGEVCTHGSSRRGTIINVPFTEDNLGELDYNRPAGRLVSCGFDTYMVRPLVRRTRRKGIFHEDYEVINLATSRRTPLSGVHSAHRMQIHTALYGLARPTSGGSISTDGSLAMVTTGAIMPASPVFNNSDNPLNEDTSRFIGVLGAALGRSVISIDTAMDFDSATLRSLEQLFNLSPASLSLFWFEARIGTVQGRTITINGSADLLAPIVRSNFPEYEVEINAAA